MVRKRCTVKTVSIRSVGADISKEDTQMADKDAQHQVIREINAY